MVEEVEKNAKVLLVEDDDIDREAIIRLFKKNNIDDQLAFAKDGLEALSMLNGKDDSCQLKPSLILLDINMPKMNGFEFLEIIRAQEQFNHINVIMLTTSDREDDIKDARRLNVTDYITKPFKQSDLNLVVWNIS